MKDEAHDPDMRPASGERSLREKLALLARAEELGSVSAACAELNFSRDSYYRFKRAYASGGLMALRAMVRHRARPGNRVGAQVEKAVLSVHAAHPGWGTTRIASHLRDRLGLSVSPAGVRGVLGRHHPAPPMLDAGGAPRRPAGPRGRARQDAPDSAAARNDMAGAILAAALALFAERNYSTVTMKDIAEALGINPSLIHYYFGSKESLFLQVVENAALRAHQTFLAIRAGVDEPADIIRLWVLNHVSQFKLMQDLIRISVDYAQTHQGNDKIDAAIRKFYRIEAHILEEALARGIAAGSFREVEIKRTATFISTFLDGVLVRSIMFAEFDETTAVHDLVEFIMGHVAAGAG